MRVNLNLRDKKKFGSLKPTVTDFLELNWNLVANCFGKVDSSNLIAVTSLSRLWSFLFKIRKSLFELYCLSFLLIREPKVLLAQFAIRRGGGISGSYQFQRLYEIRRFLRTKKIKSVIEFGSGASSLLFNKYV